MVISIRRTAYRYRPFCSVGQEGRRIADPWQCVIERPNSPSPARIHRFHPVARHNTPHVQFVPAVGCQRNYTYGGPLDQRATLTNDSNHLRNRHFVPQLNHVELEHDMRACVHARARPDGRTGVSSAHFTRVPIAEPIDINPETPAELSNASDTRGQSPPSHLSLARESIENRFLLD